MTYTFADGSTLGVQFQGAATATANGDETDFAAMLGVLGGTGRYASATGTGIFTGSRQAALGHHGGGDVRPDHRRSELTYILRCPTERCAWSTRTTSRSSPSTVPTSSTP